MTNQSEIKKRKPKLIAGVITFVLLCVCMQSVLMLHYSLKQRVLLEAADRFMTFESKVERLFYSNVMLLQGYEAYIKTNLDTDEDITYRYLDSLLSGNMNYIRNIGIIEDTTIIWNYPKESNAMAIGTDLSTVESQRDLLLKVKTERKPIMQGPVTLVQGGTGFIVRLPIVMDNTGYWGQVSIVLKADDILNEIGAYAETSGLNMAIFNQERNSVPFFGAIESNGNPTLTFEIDPTFINWKAEVYLPNIWSENILLFGLLIAFSVGFSSLVGLLIYKYLKSNYEILKMSTHDFLTGLYNRHFLDEYQTIVLSNAKRETRKVAIMLLDLNKFKKINDTYGHSVGDKVLVETARILKESTRTNEAAFRLGGDEFLIIIPEVKDVGCLQVIKDRLCKRFDEEFNIPGYSIKATPSIGCALFPDDGDDIDTLLQTADKRMYLEKSERYTHEL